MIPKLGSGNTIKIQQYKDRTYRIDFVGKRIVGIVDGLEAGTQAVRKVLETERYSERIYSGDYGIELERLVGASKPFVESNLPMTLEEAFEADERIVSIESIEITSPAIDTLEVAATIRTKFGEVSATFGIGE